MHWFTGLFLLLLLASTATRSWLNRRQVVAVLRHRGQVPEAFAQKVDLKEHQKAADYTVAHARLNRWDVLLDTTVALLLTLGGGLSTIDGWWQAAGLSPTWHGTAVVLSTFLIIGVIGLPFSLWRTFGIEARFEFNRMTPKLWIIDLFKMLGLSLLLGTPLLFVILYLMQEAGTLWWVYAWIVWSVWSIIIMWAYPAIFAPWFNKFTPVTDEAVKQRTEAVLERCGFTSKGVFTMDGSVRSTHGNAYFTGIGRNKRIVFFDTLLERLQAPEVEAVLAHELGHFRLHHIRSGLILQIVMGLVFFLLLNLLMHWPAFYSALGVTTPSTHMALLLFLFVLPPFTYFLTPLGAWWSRKHEFEADEFASKHADAKDLANALVKLHRDNASTLTPDSLHSAFYDSHPPALVRITRLLSLATQRS